MKTPPWFWLLAAGQMAGCSNSSSSSASSSGSSGGSGGAACGSVTLTGACSGSVLEFCDPTTHELAQEDCSQLVPDGGEVYACQLIDATYGYDCAAPTGKSCLQADSAGDTFPGFCQGSGPGCVFGTSDATCEVNLPPCAGYDADGGFVFANSPPNAFACSGNLLQFYCIENQPVAQDCAAIGGTCGQFDAGGACIGLPSGDSCDNAQYFCAPPLSCTDPDGGGRRYCG
jgi:hypothetical protein